MIINRTYPSRTSSWRIGLLATFSIAVASASADTTLFTDGFDNISPGSLSTNGAPKWGANGSDPGIWLTNLNYADGALQRRVATNSGVSTGTPSAISQLNLSQPLTTYSAGKLSFEIGTTTGSPQTTGLSIGSGNAATGIGFYLSGNQFYYRPSVVGGTITTLTQSDGSSFNTASNQWYRIDVGLDFTSNQVTSVHVVQLDLVEISGNWLWQEGITTQLYFGANTETMTFGESANNWTTVRLRAGLSYQDKAYIDNINLTAIPEASTYALILGCVAVGLIHRRIRQRTRISA